MNLGINNNYRCNTNFGDNFIRNQISKPNPKPKTAKETIIYGNFDDWMNFIFRKIGVEKLKRL